MMKKFPYPIVVDTDIGDDIDDTWAILYMIASGGFDIRLITVSNYDVEYKTLLMMKLLKEIRCEIPIATAKATALPKGYVRGQGRWLGDYAGEGYHGRVYREGYLERIHETVTNAEGKVCFFSLGTNRTLADYLARYPQDKDKIFVYGMAGAVNKSYEGLQEVVAEFNIASDLEASKKVFESGVDYTMLPLDVCADLRLEGEEYARFLEKESVYAKLIRENYRAWLKDAIFENKNTFERGSSILFDVIVPWFALYPEFFETAYEPVFIDSDGITKKGGDRKIRYAYALKDRDRLFRLFVDAL